MSYKKSKDCWVGLIRYNLNGENVIEEKYTPRVTMSYVDWIKYVGRGDNVILGSGGVIPSGTSQTTGGNSGTVYNGYVRQGW